MQKSIPALKKKKKKITATLDFKRPKRKRNKMLNNLFGETVSEEEQIMFHYKNRDLCLSPFFALVPDALADRISEIFI